MLTKTTKVAAKIGTVLAFAAPFVVAAIQPAAAQVPPPTTWTGFYIGADFGAALASNNATWVPEPEPPTAFGVRVQSQDNTGGGLFGGVHAGYMWQVAPRWVGGGELDWAWSGAKGAFTQDWIALAGNVEPNSFTTMGSRLNWISSARGRIGYLVMPDFMVYGTGGLAFGSLDYHALNTNGTDYTTRLSTSRVQLGFAAGIGAEWAITRNWHARAEYLFYQLEGGPDRQVFSPGTFATTYPSRYSWGATNVSAARIGVSYKF
ncbi:MAG TPA: outer membrane beta-barrel protein [Stellaceae bacterium]|nr:outer membrane beta-barrel protein [Stellaceae bacterium]